MQLNPCLHCGAEAGFAVDAGNVMVLCQQCKIRTPGVPASIDYTAKIRAAEVWNAYCPPMDWPAWQQPTGAHDAYNLGARVEHGGKRWTSLVAANVWEPGVSGWRQA